MEEIFSNKKELFVGKRIFTCDFFEDVNKAKGKIAKEAQQEVGDELGTVITKEKREDYNVKVGHCLEESEEWQKNDKSNWFKKSEKKNGEFDQNKSDDEEEEKEEEKEEEEEEEECIENNLKQYMFNQDVKIKIGTIRFLGVLKNHVSDETYYGIEWDNEFKGKNKGNFKQVYYFYPYYFLKKKKAQLYYRRNETLKHLRNDQTYRKDVTGDVVDDIVGNADEEEKEKQKEKKKEKGIGEKEEEECNIKKLRNGSDKEYDEEFLKRFKNISPCSFVSLHNISVGITFIQALHFRYNYFPELNLSITDYQTEKTKKMFFAGEQKVMKHFKNYLLLENITLNKYLIHECGEIKDLCFQNLKSLSLSFNLFSKWNDIFKIIKLAKKLSYINLSNNRFMKLDKNDLYDIEKDDGKQNKGQYLYNEEEKEKTNLVFFEQVKELCLDNTMIDWDQIQVLSFIFPNLEILSLKKNYLTSIDIHNWETADNEITQLYVNNVKYNKRFNTSEEIIKDITTCANNNNSNITNNINTNTNTDVTNNYNNNNNNNNIEVRKTNKTNCFFLKNLKKIVLNDNYLHSYEQLFYFVYKIKSIESIFVNNNKFSDNNHLVDIAYTICTSEDKYVKKKKEKLYTKEIEDPLNPVPFVDSAIVDSVNSVEFNDRMNLLINGKKEKKEKRHSEKESIEQKISKNKTDEKDTNKKDTNKKETDERNEEVTMDGKENQFEFINKHFKHLKEFLFDNNEIKHYETLRDLFYIFYDLEVLKIKNKKNYLKETKHMRYILISILPKLKVLNHSSINKNERIHSERFFISLYKRDKVAQIFNQLVLNRRHSTLLEKIHYKAQPEDDSEKTKTMQSNLINITIVPEFLDSQHCNVIKKKVNKYMNIKDLKYLCSRLYSISFPKMKLYYTDENSPISIEILDTNADLYTYGIENNAKIKIQLDD